MEGSGDVFSDDNTTFSEKKQKRKVKTPSQIDALEKLYKEHKYPSETLKLQLAESLGLTEKQISGWFCHRRLKDKKLKDDTSAHGRQDRSSGVIQDRGSGLGQDSCGSTKQGEQRHCDPREVESRSFTVEGVRGAAEITYDLENHFIQNHCVTDDTSSASSSHLQDNCFPQSTDAHGVVTSRNIIQSINMESIDAKCSKGRTGPSGYLKVKVQAEHVAITSVKRQLGRHYREDGPSLGIDFDPLPPDAFESPIRDPVEEPDFVSESFLPHSSYDSRTCKQPHRGRGYEERKSKMGSHNSDLDDTSYHIMNGSNSHEDHPPLQYERKPYSSMEMKEFSLRKAPVHDIQDNFEIKAKHDVGWTKEPVSTRHLLAYGRKFTVKQREPSDRGDVYVKISQRDNYECSPPSMLVKNNKFHMEKGLSRRATKEGDIYGEKRKADDPVKVTVYPANEFRPPKRSREDFAHQRNATKATIGEKTQWLNPSKRSLTEVPSSFSEDETGETGSSAD